MLQTLSLTRKLNRNKNQTGRKAKLKRYVTSSCNDKRDKLYKFVQPFRNFLANSGEYSGLGPDIESKFRMNIDLNIDDRWKTSICDDIRASWTYLGFKFTAWSEGFEEDGKYCVHLYADFGSIKYRSGGIYNPEEFGKKLGLLTCEAERIDSLPWWRKVPEKAEQIAQVTITIIMCISFLFNPQSDWERIVYVLSFLAFGSCAGLSYISLNKEEHAIINSNLEKQARV